MRKPLTVEEWLKDEPEQVAWTWEQLRPSRALPDLERELQRKAVIEAVTDHLRLHGEPAFTRLKRRWNQAVFRQRKDLKTYNFVLPTATARRLGVLARGSTRSTVIKELIEEAASLRQKYEKALKEEKARLQQTHEKLVQSTPRLSGPTKGDYLRVRKVNEELGDVVHEWEEITDALLRENIRLRTILAAYDLQDETLDPTQEASAHHTFEAAKANIVGTLKDKTTLAKIFEPPSASGK